MPRERFYQEKVWQNIGVAVLHTHTEVRDDGKVGMKDVNLRELLKAFGEIYPNARRLLEEGEVVGEFKGAPLRCSLEGARWSSPGLLVTGDAAGSTYAFSGEGIGKAMETGLLAAQALLAGRDGHDDAHDDALVRAHYDASLGKLKPRFDLYEKANVVNTHPWRADLVIWRAQRSPKLLRRMSGVLNETSNPGQLLSLKGVYRLITG